MNKSNEQIIRYTDIPAEIHQLAADIDDFWGVFDPYDECYSGIRSEEEINKNILYFAKEIYEKGTEAEIAVMLREAVISSNSCRSPQIAEKAKRLVGRINDVKSKANNLLAIYE